MELEDGRQPLPNAWGSLLQTFMDQQGLPVTTPCNIWIKTRGCGSTRGPRSQFWLDQHYPSVTWQAFSPSWHALTRDQGDFLVPSGQPQELPAHLWRAQQSLAVHALTVEAHMNLFARLACFTQLTVWPGSQQVFTGSQAGTTVSQDNGLVSEAGHFWAADCTQDPSCLPLSLAGRHYHLCEFLYSVVISTALGRS